MQTSNDVKAKRALHELPTDVVRPVHYDVHTTLDTATFLFSGESHITVDVLQPTDEITVHTEDQKILAAHIFDESGRKIYALASKNTVTWTDADTGKRLAPETYDGVGTIDEERQTVAFKFEDKVQPGRWTLVIKYQGSTIQPSLDGFHRTKWVDKEKKVHYVFNTQFEPTRFRHWTPGWDQPAAKATFTQRWRVPEHLVVLSNMDEVSCHHDGNGWKEITFARSPKMPTYDVACVIGELESSRVVIAKGIKITIWSIPGLNHLKEFALHCVPFSVRYLTRHYGRPYFAGKQMKMVALPEYKMGAMEHPGLITYNMTSLLCDWKTATVSELKRVAEVIFHEWTHQWDGNAVTMYWWDGLPNNESNAYFIAYLQLHAFDKKWCALEDLAYGRLAAFSLNALKSTHPIWAPVGSPSEAEQRFDALTYNGGGSVFYMLMRYIGERAFWAGKQLYMNRHWEGNAEFSDLMQDHEDAARALGVDLPIRKILESWFLQEGNPIVSVSESDQDGCIRLHQERFSFLRGVGKDQLWQIPVHIRYCTANGFIRHKKLLFTERDMDVRLTKGFRWAVVNADGCGFYRLRYSQSMLDKLLADPHGILGPIERLNLVNDYWAFVQAEMLNSDEYLGIVEKLAPGEVNANVWSIVAGALKTLYSFTTSEHQAAFQKLIVQLARPMFDKLGWKASKDDSPTTRELRGTLAHLLATAGGDEDVQREAVKEFESWKVDRNSVDPNLAAVLPSIVAYTGDAARFEEFLKLAGSAPTEQEQLRFQAALGWFRQQELIDRAIAYAINVVKPDNSPGVLAAYLGPKASRLAAWKAICANWDLINRRSPNNRVARMAGACAALHDTPELANEVRAFFATHKIDQSEEAIAQMLDALDVNERRRRTQTPVVQAYMARAAKNG